MLRRSLAFRAANKKWPVYGKLDQVLLIGFGSIGRATLPLLERHFEFDPSNVTILDPKALNFHLLKDRKYNIVNEPLTDENYLQILDKYAGTPGSFIINLSVDVGSAAIIEYCQKRGDVRYLDTVIEPWAGGYQSGVDGHKEAAQALGEATGSSASRSNYAMREEVLELKRKYCASKKGPTAITCCGANPGMVSWFMKDALLDIARDTGVVVPDNKVLTRPEWAQLAQTLGVKGVHIAERDTQQSRVRRPHGVFVNTWSCDGFICEGFEQPAELGWGSHEKWMPSIGRRHEAGCGAGIYLEQPGGMTNVRSWCPTMGSQRAFLVTHNEAISISDYYTVPGATGNTAAPAYRPTAHYAYHMCEETIGCCHEMISSGKIPQKREVLVDGQVDQGGYDELGVLVYGHKKNAYWLGSKLSVEQAQGLAPWQNPTAMQVSSAALAGVVYGLRNPNVGIIEADEMEHKQCLEVQKPYLGDIIGKYTDWTPLEDNFVEKMFPKMREGRKDESDPWQFQNVLVHYNN